MPASMGCRRDYGKSEKEGIKMETNELTLYKVVRNDGVIYMECDRDTAVRLARQLNEKYKGLYSYKAVRADG